MMSDVTTSDQTRVVIAIHVEGESWGEIQLKFDLEVAPNHVKNMVTLAKNTFYDGTTFHRVIPGFMIQGGDPHSKDADRSRHGTGGPGHHVNAEFSQTLHKRGTLSMARAQDPNSAGSQFFICVADANFLDGQYTAFGEVMNGMEIVDRIVNVQGAGNDNPLQRIEMTLNVIDANA